MFSESLGSHLTRRLTTGAGLPEIDFRAPRGEAALVPADSVSWRIFKNPVALFVGGIAAVLLELAEPRVRTGVWEHTSFRNNPVPRMKRTGLAAMVTIYGARSVATKMIAGVCRLHDHIAGATPAGVAYRANDPELLDWVHVTAAFGFLEAYSAFVHSLTPEERDRYYAEGTTAAALYGAQAPRDAAGQWAMFARMMPKLERSDIVFEFLDIVGRAPILPLLSRPTQSLFIRAAVEIVPPDIRALLGLQECGLRNWETMAVKSAGAVAEHLRLSGPATQACERLGLPADYLYRR
ncbi:MAG TPA: oxygenase MpaB family protein [Rhizomicrobium sp.]|jgi:uncharacterized protein (DUF2236 family)|nr:oxygenase MpaB family protein [Rhizomicrobium sp.]